MTPAQPTSAASSAPVAQPANPASNQARGYRVPIEQSPYTPPPYTFSDDDNEGE